MPGHADLFSDEQGFTLIELLVVILIIGVLAAVAIPTFLSQSNKAKDAVVETNLNALQTAETTYSISNNGAYTTSLSTLTGTEPAINSLSPSNYSLESSGPNSPVIRYLGNGSPSLDYVAAGSAAPLTANGTAAATTAVTYYIALWSDGFAANVCWVPTGVNAGGCNVGSNTPSNGGTQGTWGNGQA